MCFYGWLWCFIWTSGFIDSVCSRIIRGAFTEHAYNQAPTPWFSLVWDSPDKSRRSNLQVTVMYNWDWKPLVNRNIQSNITLSWGTQQHARLSVCQWLLPVIEDKGTWSPALVAVYRPTLKTPSLNQLLNFLLFYCETAIRGKKRAGKLFGWLETQGLKKPQTSLPRVNVLIGGKRLFEVVVHAFFARM